LTHAKSQSHGLRHLVFSVVSPEEFIRQSKIVRELARLGAIAGGHKYLNTEFSELLDNRAEKRHVGRVFKVNPDLAAFESLSGWLWP